jgi:hypothetical protein
MIQGASRAREHGQRRKAADTALTRKLLLLTRFCHARAKQQHLWHTVAYHLYLLIKIMRKILLAGMLLITLPAFAQGWVRYAQTDAASMYFDSLHTRKMGDTAFVWDLHDLVNAATEGNGKTYRSALYAIEYNCRARKRRVLGATFMTESMGKGATAAEESLVSDWTDAATGSLAGELFKHICE